MNFVANSYFIFQISQVKILKLAVYYLDVYLTSLNKIIDKIA